MKNKILSVIIPAYNAEKYIRECLESFYELALQDVEIIVINDGSSDNTAAVVEECIIRDNRISLFSVPNGGVSKARNYGIEQASGKFIMFLDADDYLIKDAFDIVNKSLSADRDFTAFSRTILEKSGKKWDDDFTFQGIECGDKEIIDCIMYADSLFNECWGKLFKKSVIDEFNIRFPVGIPIGEDTMFVIEFYSHAQSVYAYNIPLVAYRQHDNSTMRKKSIDERLKYTNNLFDYSQKFIPNKLKSKVLYYNFKIITNLCREYSKDAISPNVIKTIYFSDVSEKIMKNLDSRNIPMYRRHEYFLINRKKFILSAIYYHIKAKIT